MPQPKCSDFWCKFGVFCSKTQNLELNLEFRSQNILKPINCQMCGIYFKNNFFLHVQSRIFSWLCLVFLWKVDISRHQETHEKSTKSSKCSRYHFLTFEDQGSGYSLGVSKVTLRWTGSVKILTKGQLGSNLIDTDTRSFNKSFRDQN